MKFWIDSTLLEELRQISRRENKTLTALMSEMLIESLKNGKKGFVPRTKLDWVSQPMGACIDITDKDRLFQFLDHNYS